MADDKADDPALERVMETVRTVLHRDGLDRAGGGGVAGFGTGEASGPDRAVKAAVAALRDLKRQWTAE